MNIVVWIFQVLLAFLFLMHGRTMISPPDPLPERMVERMGWISDIPKGLRLFIGIVEVLAALGLILPALTGILPWLTALAASGLIIVMASAIAFHLSRRENRAVIPNLVLLVVASFVAYMRWVVLPL